MRLFLAINPPPEVRRAIWDATQPLREVSAGVAWVAEPKIHLTLKFLGDQPESAAAPIGEMLRGIAMGHATPLVRVGAVGAFPNFRRPRVVWLGVDPDPRLELLHHDVEVACAALGYELDGRPFRPHLTIGRVKEPGTVEQTRALRGAARKVRFSDEFSVPSIDLMQSLPGIHGSTYTALAVAPMRGR